MKNKKGFSLVEILAVIVVVGIIAGIGTTAYTGIKSSILNSEYENLVTQIELAATEYARDTSLAAVTVYTLIKEGYIASENNGIIYSPVDDTALNCQTAYNTYVAGEYSSELKITELEDEDKKEGNAECGAKFEYLTNIEVVGTLVDDWYKGTVTLSLKDNSNSPVLYKWTSKTSMYSSNEAELVIEVDNVVDTTYYLYVEYADGTFENHSIVVRIDNVNPVITEVSSSSSWSGSNKTIHVEDIDQGSGVSKYYLVDASSGTCPTIGYTSYDDYNTMDFDNGFYCVYVEDVVGNESEKIYFEVSGIDKTPPTTGVTYNDSVAQSIEITITSDDGEGSGIDGKGYALIRIDNDEDCEGATYTAANKIEVTENGLYAACSKDKAGNTSITPSTEDDTSSLIIKINSVDRTPPVVTITQDNENVWSQSKKLTVKADDGIDTEDAKVAGVNVNGYAIILSTENCETAKLSSTKEKTVTVNGTYKACVADDAGNIGEAEIVVSKIDTTNPTVTLTQSIPSPYTTVTLTAKGTDSQSGVYGYYFTTSTTCSTSVSAYNTKTTASYTANTTYRVCVIDNAGNTNNTTITVTGIDKIAPTISTIVPSTNSTYTSASVTVSATDSLSGIYGYYFTTSSSCSTSFSSYNSTKTMNYTVNGTYRACVIDKAGNVANKSFTISTIDTVDPTVSVTQSKNSTYSTVTTYAKGSDNLSGVYGYYYTLSTSSCYSSAYYYSSSQYNYYSSNGIYKACVRDMAGNTGYSTFTVSDIDTTAPTVSATTSAGNGSTTIKASSSDSQSGVAGYIIQTSSTKPSSTSSSWSTTSSKIVYSPAGYYVFAKDYAGNVSSGYYIYVNVSTSSSSSGSGSSSSGSGSSSSGSGSSSSGSGSSSTTTKTVDLVGCSSSGYYVISYNTYTLGCAKYVSGPPSSGSCPSGQSYLNYTGASKTFYVVVDTDLSSYFKNYDSSTKFNNTSYYKSSSNLVEGCYDTTLVYCDGKQGTANLVGC